MQTPPQFFLIDGYALIYRAFFALISRPLRTSKGENTSAAWGVVNFLLRLREKYHPDYLAWVNDAGDSFRTQMYPEYKSTREKLDDELQADFDRSVLRIGQMLEGFHIPVVTVPGYEADDVIGTMARLGVERGWQSIIVSGDKDFYQLIRPGVALLNPGRGGPAAVDELWVDESNAAERLGVPPSQVVDYLALVGDTSDNVPGVKGIGGKGAVELLREFGDLETMLARAPEIRGKRAREALLAHADEARLSQRLVTIQCDVPVTLDPDRLLECEPDRDALLRMFGELEFYSLTGRLGLVPTSAVMTPPAPAAAAAAMESPSTEVVADELTAAPTIPVGAPTRIVEVVDDPSRLAGIARRLREVPLIALDTETSSLEPHSAELIGLSLAAGVDEVWYLPFGHRPQGGELAAPAPVRNLPPITDPACEPILALLRDASVPKAGHNIKYDWQVLRRAGVEIAGVVYDSMLASFVLDPGRRSHAIDTLSVDHLGMPMRTYTDLTGRGKSQIPFAEVAVEEAAAYCGADSATVLALHGYFARSLTEMALEPLLRDIEMPLVPVLVDMEWSGIAIDRPLFQRLSLELGVDLTALEKDIMQLAGGDLNLNSPRQLATLLFEKLQLPVLKKTKTGPSTDADVLEQLAAMGHEVPRRILEYRELQKLRSTYVDVLPQRVNAATGRIHTSFNQAGAATGRLSSSDPNLQNIPVRSPRGEALRRGFIPAPGCSFIVADYSQIELRLMAHLSDDPEFIRAFREGGDIHRQTAALIFSVPLEDVTSEMRGRAKTINFATIYGQGPFALGRQLGIPQDEARLFIARYFERFAGVRSYLDRQVELARERGYVETIFGRRRYIPEIRDRNFNMRAYGERNAQNSPLQGSAADLIKIAMERIHTTLRESGLRSRMLLQVHDELVLEAPEAELLEVRDIVTMRMEHAATLKVPLVVDVGIGANWLDAKH
ncbi:MAG: DNA polymerase I [Gemmatimonadota bacterium]